MKVYVILMIKQIEDKFCVIDERDFYIKDVYTKKEQARKAMEYEEELRSRKYKSFIFEHETKSKFKIEPFRKENY